MKKIINYAIITLGILLSMFFTSFAWTAQHQVQLVIPACGQ